MRLWNKRLAGICSVLLLSVFMISADFGLPVSAAGNLPRLTDMADLLSDSEEFDLSEMLDEISERQQVDLVVVTVGSTDGKSAMVYADDFYDENGYGFGDGRDGILLLISMDERDWYISTTGYGITALTDAGLEYLSEIIVADLSEGNYAAAFTGFAKLCDDFISQARTGEPYDIGNLPREPFNAVRNLAVAFGIAFMISLAVTGIMKSQLKTVRKQAAADNYIKQGSMQLTKKNELFLYQNVDRRKREEKSRSGGSGGSRTHISSSGTRHGGKGGKF